MGCSVPVDGKRVPLDSRLPLLPLRDTVLFPGAVLPLFIGRPGSLAVIESAQSSRKCLLAVAQRRPEVTSPKVADLFGSGVIGYLRQVIRLPDGTMRILLEGTTRARLRRLHETAEGTEAEYSLWRGCSKAQTGENHSLFQRLAAVRGAFLEYARTEARISQEELFRCLSEEDPDRASCLISSHLVIPLEERQQLLEASGASPRLDLLLRFLAAELEEPRWGRRASLAEPAAMPPVGKAAEAHSKTGRPPAKDGDEAEAELEQLQEAIHKAKMPPAVQERAERELQRLSKMAFLSPEATVARTYVEWLLALPWKRRTRDRGDLRRAEEILDEEHYGLRPVKDRILEQIAVMKLSRAVKGPVLCLTGPPGVGKTSLGRSIARALQRRFIRMSLGGIRDEAEIRGHRRTYIGALPGRIIQAMKRAGSCNPVILLDEVDKLGVDYRGDPAAALLEVLDPEQNSAFSDHYLEVDYDLSHVLFLTTANDPAGIPPALRDRMEVIPLPGYLETEKLAIAERFLLPKQRDAAGLLPADLEVPPATLGRIIREYTREAGVRNLEREIARLARRVAREKAVRMDAKKKVTKAAALRRVTPDGLEAILGTPRFAQDSVIRSDRVGISTALAWTETGGTILQVEVGVLPGRGRLALTGRLGSTLRESARAALSCVRSQAARLGLKPDFYRSVDIHLHIPDGAMPKDGPSAGAAIALAMVSALTRRPTRESVAITGELTLTGRILPIGGLSEKLLAALRAGAKTVLIPADNERQLADVPQEVRRGLRVVPVSRIDEVFQRGLALTISKEPGAFVESAVVAFPAASARRGQDRHKAGSRARRVAVTRA